MEACYISVDVETSGPTPGVYSMLSLGACTVADPEIGFYSELRPVTTNSVPEAVEVSGLDLERLLETGEPPEQAMPRFVEWVETTASARRPVFVALNAPFDWMFVADYLHRFAGRNPFGHSALDMKALFMGMAAVPWQRTTLRDIAAWFGIEVELPHHALEDAVAQAEVFRAMLRESHVSGQRGEVSTE